MKLTFKTQTKEHFQLDFEEGNTILEVKQKIEAEKGYDLNLQKLIFSGQLLADDKTVGECGITEDGFVVVAVISKAAANKSASTHTSQSKPTPSQSAKPVTATARSDASQLAPTTGSSTQINSTDQNADQALLTGAGTEQAVQSMVEMGFPLDQVKHAMLASFNNPDRAVEYLMNGIPDGQENSSAPIASSTTPGISAIPAMASGGSGNTSPRRVTADLSFLRSNPLFQQLRQAIRANPDSLQSILEESSQSNPEIMQFIEANRQAFMKLLDENDQDADTDAIGGPQPNICQIDVTVEEKDAIERLVEMGFDRADVIQAYFACDKNEELTATFLLDR